ncbi:NUDIX hydrolase [Microlunatus ginsengisoli]|uniref:CoA pyrophosphatase n=1 Tax=Microlunatus ginsengisoli TaxID=363863 RepID=A0ABP7AP49_9ACTN
MSTPDWLHSLLDALDDHERLAASVALRPGVGARAAAVLMLIGEGPRGPEILFVERAASLRTHAGQIAFPGGAADPGDADLAVTALREAQEETGVDPTGIRILGSLPPAHVEVSGFDVTAVVGWWQNRSPVGPADPREVASVVVVPVADLLDPAKRVRVTHPSGYVGPAFQVGGHLIWGLTAHLLDGLLGLAGWQADWDDTPFVTVPARYLTDRSDTSGGQDAH